MLMNATYVPRSKRKRARLSLWHKFVLLVGYGTLLYSIARGVVYLLVLMNDLK